MQLKNKVALVTGASRGIGRAIATRFASEGAFVIAHYGQNEAQAEELIASFRKMGSGGFTVGADLSDVNSLPGLFGAIRAKLRAAGRPENLDILVNNAGVANYIPFMDTTPSLFDALFNVNVKGVFFVTQLAVPMMRDGAKIINISSVAAQSVTPNLTAYSATKGALDVLTRQWAAELGQKGITVNSLSPGATDTEMNSAVFQSEEGVAMVLSKQALKRVAKPEDIANAAAALAGSDCGWITGQVIEVCGGWAL